MLNSHPGPMNYEPLFKGSWEPMMKGYVTFWQAHLARLYAGYGHFESTDEGDVITGITISDTDMAVAAITTLAVVQVVKQELIEMNILTVTDAVSLQGTPVYHMAINDLCVHIKFAYYYNRKEHKFKEIKHNLNAGTFLDPKYKSSREARAFTIIKNHEPEQTYNSKRIGLLQRIK